MSTLLCPVIPIAERGLDLDVGVIIRGDVATRALVRHLISHLHRAAHQARVLAR